MVPMKLDWDRLEKLRGPQSLAKALNHLGVKEICVVRRELRGEESGWVRVPTWLRETEPLMAALEKNEIGSELLKRLRDEAQEEALRLQQSVFRSNALGLTEIAIPLVLRGERVGLVTMGGITIEDPRPSTVALEDRLKVLMLGGEEKATVLAAFEVIPQFSSDKRAMVIQMLELLSREIIQFFEESLTSREREDSVHRNTFSQWVTANPALRATLKKIQSIAEQDTSVLIQGESGTGRELLAKLIHEQSPRRANPFRTLHCSSTSENLLEAEIVGYEKGAFAGAYQRKQGLFEQAKGGTIYLKEVGDLSLPMQHKILRILQDGSFMRLGGSDEIQADMRVVASTQRNLKKLVQVGAFREDLYFRLNVIELELPPLRNRREDIALLAEHFLHFFQKQMAKEGIQFKEEAIVSLRSHAFPGNVRELRNEVERLVAIKEPQSFISASELSPKIVETMSPIEEIEKGATLKELVDIYEKSIIQEALGKYHWNKSRVAELFQITRQGLLKKISKHQLDKRKRV